MAPVRVWAVLGLPRPELIDAGTVARELFLGVCLGKERALQWTHLRWNGILNHEVN